MPESPDPPCVILARRRGRPPAPPTWAVSTRLPEGDMDRLIRLATQHDVAVAALVRAMLQVAIREAGLY